MSIPDGNIYHIWIATLTMAAECAEVLSMQLVLLNTLDYLANDAFMSQEDS